MKFLSVLFIVLLSFSLFAGACDECKEVAAGEIPAAYLKPTVKELPSGVKIFDIPELLENYEKDNFLWVDTRPQGAFINGTLSKSILLTYDKKESPVNENSLTEERLLLEMAKINKDMSLVKVVFFCNGPGCHRGYNAALRAVNEFDIQADNIVWFREGFPALVKLFENDASLKGKVGTYLKGTSFSSK